MVPPAEPVSYYGRPVLKPSVWKWMIPAYFFTGGVAAGSATIAFGARRQGNARLARRSNVTGLAAVVASAALLVADLGRPARFVNMLRVAKPTSPMSVGTWLLTIFGPAVGVAAASDVTGWVPSVGALAEFVAAAAAPAVATYTAVLVSDTAVPAWHEARHELPFAFAGGAAASAGGLACVFVPPADAEAARRFAIAGAVSELRASAAMHERLQAAGVLGAGTRSEALRRAAQMTTASGAVLLVGLGRRRMAAIIGGLAVAAGAALERFAVVEMGRESALDPKTTIGPQREQMGPERATLALDG